MTPISPEEISALLDGELAPERAGEVRRAIAGDERLRQIYQRMSHAHRDLSSFAAACQFEPRIALPPLSPLSGTAIYAVAFGLLAVRILAKVLPMVPGIWLQGLAIALVAAWIVGRFLPKLDVDRWQALRELGLDQPLPS